MENSTDDRKPRTPDFLIVGAAKSGTTSLVNYLGEHPEIEIVSSRLEYFGEYWNPAEGEINRQTYLQYFKGIPSDTVAGEKSVSYLYSRQAVDEIFELNPQMKIIMVLRDPTERAYSDYWHRKRMAVENLNFEEALESEEVRIAKGVRFELHYANYGRYFAGVSAYIQRFGVENVLAIRYEDLKTSPESTCEKCFDLLRVDKSFRTNSYPVYNKGTRGKKSTFLRALFWMSQQAKIVPFVRFVFPGPIRSRITRWMTKSNQQADYPEMGEETKVALHEFFEDDIKKLEDLLGWDLSSWRT